MIKSRTYHNYPCFKSQILRQHGKTKDAIYAEFIELKRKPNEPLLRFLDR